METKLTLLLIIALLPSCATTGGTSQPGEATGVKPYPLKTCLVTGNDLGSMGDPQRIVHNGQEIKFCCEPCVGKFRKNPEKYLAMLR